VANVRQYPKEEVMCTPQTRKECIFSRWDATDDDMQLVIFEEFKKKYKGCYTERDLLNFLEKKFSETVNPEHNNRCQSPPEKDEHLHETAGYRKHTRNYF
jgi:hypothetical protein